MQLSETIKHLVILLRRVIGFIAFALVDRVAIRHPLATIQQTLLIVRVDVLGDYILFRNFIGELKKSSQYKGYKITFCGNQALKEFVDFFDGDLIDDFIWLDRERFVLNVPYRYRMLRGINSRGFEVAVNSQYSREFFHGDAIIRASRASKRIGSGGDLNNMGRWQKYISDRYYTKLIPAEDNTLFEFYRNQNFFENFIDEKIAIKKPSLDTRKIPPTNFSTHPYVVLHPGARLQYRQWLPENFAKIADVISAEYGLDIIIVGSKNEVESANKVISSAKVKNIIDLSGKTNLVQLTKIISEAELLIVNDTGTAHIAAAVDTPVIVISNGNHFGRFIPYPAEVFKDVYGVFPESIKVTTENTKYIEEKYKFYSNLNINTVTVDTVKEVIRRVIDTIQGTTPNLPSDEHKI